MRDVFEKVAKAYEGAKESVKNKWENFKKKFEGTKSEMSQEVMNAKSPDELINLGKRLQQKGEALKTEEEAAKQEESEEKKLESEKSGMIESAYGEALEEDAARDKEKAHGEAIEENKAFDEARVAKAAEEEAKRKAEIAEQDRLQAEEDAKKVADILKKIQGTGGESKESLEKEKSFKDWEEEDWVNYELKEAKGKNRIVKQEQPMTWKEEWQTAKDLEGASIQLMKKEKNKADDKSWQLEEFFKQQAENIKEAKAASGDKRNILGNQIALSAESGGWEKKLGLWERQLNAFKKRSESIENLLAQKIE